VKPLIPYVLEVKRTQRQWTAVLLKIIHILEKEWRIHGVGAKSPFSPIFLPLIEYVIHETSGVGHLYNFSRAIIYCLSKFLKKNMLSNGLIKVKHNEHMMISKINPQYCWYQCFTYCLLCNSNTATANIIPLFSEDVHCLRWSEVLKHR
jgi:hypothetical protein